MVELQEFGHYQLSQNDEGATVELCRSEAEVVCLAFDTERRFFVELHVMDAFAERDPEHAGALEAAFVKRAERVASVLHPHLIRVLDWGMDEGTPYYVTGMVDGEALRHYAARASPVPPLVVAKLGSHLVRALQAVAAVPGLLALVDPWKSRVSREIGASGVRATACDLGLDAVELRPGEPAPGGGAAEAEAACCRKLGEILERLAGEKPAAALRALAGRIASGQVRTLAELARRLEAAEDVMREEKAVAHEVVPPQLLMSRVLRSPSDFGRIVGEGDWLPVDDRAGADPYSGLAHPADGGPLCRIQALPPLRLCQVGLGKQVQLAMSEIEPERHPNLMPVGIYWGDPDGDLFAEEIGDAMPVTQVSRAHGGLDAEEIEWVLGGVSAGIEQARGVGLTVWGLSPATILVAGAGRVAEAREGWRSLPHREGARVLLRAHPTPLNLVQPARFSADGIVPDQAAVRPEDFGAFLDLASGLAALEPNPVVRSAIGRFVISERDALRQGGLPDDGLGARQLRRAFLQRLRDLLEVSGLDDAVAVVEEEVALGTTDRPGPPDPPGEEAIPDEEEDDEEEVEAEPVEGLAQILFPDGDGADEEAAAWNPVARSVIGGGLPPEEEDEHSFIEETAQSPSFFWAVVALLLAAILAAAVIAHLSGKAFWLRDPADLAPRASMDASGARVAG